jgi:hypothetical protein
MTRNSNTWDNFLLWFIQEFGFNANAATALYNVQMLKDAKTLSELDDDTVANICKEYLQGGQQRYRPVSCQDCRDQY